MKKLLLLIPLSILASGISWMVYAPDDRPNPDQLRAQAKELQIKAAALEREGKLDAAGELSNKARQLNEQAEKLAHARQEIKRDKPHDINIDQLRGQAKELHVKAEALKREGKLDAAEELGRRAHQLLEQAERLAHARQEVKRDKPHDFSLDQLRGQAKELQAKAESLKREGKLDDAEEYAHKAQQILEQAARLAKAQGHGLPVKGIVTRREGGDKPRDLPHGDVNREEHIRAAIKHLHAAGLGDLARQLEKQVMGEKQVPERTAYLRKIEIQKEAANPAQDIQVLRKEVQELRQLLHRLIEQSDRKIEQKVVPKEKKELKVVPEGKKDLQFVPKEKKELKDKK